MMKVKLLRIDNMTHDPEDLVKLIANRKIRLSWREGDRFERVPKYRYYMPNKGSINALARMLQKLKEEDNIHNIRVQTAARGSYSWCGVFVDDVTEPRIWRKVATYLDAVKYASQMS